MRCTQLQRIHVVIPATIRVQSHYTNYNDHFGLTGGLKTTAIHIAQNIAPCQIDAKSPLNSDFMAFSFQKSRLVSADH